MVASRRGARHVKRARARGASSEPPQLTLRAVVTGLVLGAVLAPSNIYAGLKVGWAFNMAVASALLSYGFWSLVARLLGVRPMNLLENNINQVVASAGAMIASSGLVAAVPALTLLTGYAWTWGKLAAWTMTVGIVGIAVAVLTRHQLLTVERLRFPSGVATATTLQQMYARGRGAAERLFALAVSALCSAATRVATHLAGVTTQHLPGGVAVPEGSALAQRGLHRISFANLTFGFDPSLLMIAVGVLIGPRAGCSLLLGAVVSWGVLGPFALQRGFVAPGAPERAWFGELVDWLLWPGVTLMVAASVTALFGSFRAMLPRSWRLSAQGASAAGTAREGVSIPGDQTDEKRTTPEEAGSRGAPAARPLAYVFALCAGGLAVGLQVVFFDIALHIAILGLGFTFLLATVAARVTGETDITPIGAMGQVTQFVYGLLTPGNVTANLMAANVTGGAASQCADLMQDLRSGEILGASFTRLAVAQVIGVIVGALVGSAAYLVLVPDPAAMLLSDEWPAPAVATWRAAAQVFARGLDAMPEGTQVAMWVALVLGVALTLLERRLSPRIARYLPSPVSLGLAMVIPASYAISMFLGAMIAWALHRFAPRFSDRFLLVIAAGAITGESLAGVSFAMLDTLRSIFGG